MAGCATPVAGQRSSLPTESARLQTKVEAFACDTAYAGSYPIDKTVPRPAKGQDFLRDRHRIPTNSAVSGARGERPPTGWSDL